MAKRAPEIIATHLGFDLAEMKDYTYQPGSYQVALYAIGDYYYASPTKAQTGKLPKDWRWHNVGTEFGRDIYRAHMNDDAVEE